MKKMSVLVERSTVRAETEEEFFGLAKYDHVAIFAALGLRLRNLVELNVLLRCYIFFERFICKGCESVGRALEVFRS
jgi:hypothetical protein